MQTHFQTLLKEGILSEGLLWFGSGSSVPYPGAVLDLSKQFTVNNVSPQFNSSLFMSCYLEFVSRLNGFFGDSWTISLEQADNCTCSVFRSQIAVVFISLDWTRIIRFSLSRFKLTK